jgi:tetratricopeptide (TPR) repeat protein
VPLDKATIELIRERTRVEAEAAEAAEAAAAEADRPRNTVAAIARGWLTLGRLKGAGEAAEAAPPQVEAATGAEGPRKPRTGAELIRENLSGSGDRASPAAAADLPQVEAAAGAEVRRKPRTGAELIRANLSNAAYRAPADRPRNMVVEAAWGWLKRRLRDTGHCMRRVAASWTWRKSAVAAAIIVPVLAVFSAVRFDPWAGDGCPTAVNKGADCSRYGVVGRTYSALALLNVDRELDKSQWAPAKADLDLILLIRPNFAVALDARGEAEAGLGDKTASLADYDRALTLAPDDLTTRAKRGQLEQSMGETEQAAADFAVIYHADQSTPRWAGVVAFVRRIDQSTAPPKVHKPPKRRHRPSVDAASPPVQAPQSEPPAPPPEQSPQAESPGAT